MQATINAIMTQIANWLISIRQPFYYLALFVGFVFVISGVTDLFYDLFMIIRSIRRFIIRRSIKPLTLQRLESREQQRIAIFIAAWREADVIAQTLTNACQSIRYRNYDIFVGTYPNDAETQMKVDQVASKYAQVHKVITPDAGPTNKASNLNHVFHALQDYEKRSGQFYDIIVTHDSEDVIHPYSLLVYNYLMPRMDMIQIPVFPMALPLKYVTHWTYADEFAENHTKMLLVREITGGFVPSAGVGTAFTKRAFQLLALQNEQEVFSTNTLTEDYELGLRMNLSGMKAAFVKVNIPSPQTEESDKKHVADWVATRAVFPTDFKSAVRQKTRWNIGIILQGWKNVGWRGSLAIKWNLFHDRKALITSLVNFLAYFVFAYFLVYYLVSLYFAGEMPVLMEKGTLLWYLVRVATVFMIWRMVNRAYAVYTIYGWAAAITSIPRVIWGNWINFCAIVRALYQYFTSRLKKQQVAWDKTAHEFPEGVIDEGWIATIATPNKPLPAEQRKEQPDSDEIIRTFLEEMEHVDKEGKLKLVKSIRKDQGEILFPYFIGYLEDPSWEVRSSVCRTLSFLRLPQAIPYLEKAACDTDWVVRGNAVRALGKLGEAGKEALMRLLSQPDRYARDAALAILEGQGFVDRELIKLDSPIASEADEARKFFEILAQAGNSSLAQEILKNYPQDQEPGD